MILRRNILLLLSLILLPSLCYAGQFTTYYNLEIPEEGERDWISKISRDIVSIDTAIYNASSGAQVAIISSDVGVLKTATQTKSIVIDTPTTESDYSFWRVSKALTITNIYVMAKGGTSVAGKLLECDGNGANCAGVDGSTAITATAGTTQADDGSLSNAGIDAGDVMSWDTTAVTGVVSYESVFINYTIN